jgi:ferredoxin/flavodoxin
MRSAALHYFSGTGNTHRAIGIIGRKLGEAGYKVETVRVAAGTLPPAGHFDCHVFAFPVYATDVPHVMVKYLKTLPSDTARAAVIAVYGDLKVEHSLNGYEGWALEHAARILRGKGFDVAMTDAVGYPVSITIGINPPAKEDQIAIRERSDRKVEAMAARIVTGERSVKPIGLVNRACTIPFGILYMLVGRRALGKLYVADAACVGCGKCVRVCPARAISLVGKAPRWNLNCEGCQRCINSCPHRAIQTSIPRLAGMLFLQIASLVTFIGLFFLPYGDYFQGVSLGPLQVSDWWVGFVVALVVWALGFVLLTHLVLDELIWMGERSRKLRPIFRANFTHGYRRYLDPGFDPDEHGLRVSAQRK